MNYTEVNNLNIAKILGDLVENVIAVIVMLIFAILSFFVVVFVVNTGAGLAEVQADGEFVILSASIIVAATILAGLMK